MVVLGVLGVVTAMVVPVVPGVMVRSVRTAQWAWWAASLAVMVRRVAPVVLAVLVVPAGRWLVPVVSVARVDMGPVVGMAGPGGRVPMGLWRGRRGPPVAPVVMAVSVAMVVPAVSVARPLMALWRPRVPGVTRVTVVMGRLLVMAGRVRPETARCVMAGPVVLVATRVSAARAVPVARVGVGAVTAWRVPDRRGRWVTVVLVVPGSAPPLSVVVMAVMVVLGVLGVVTAMVVPVVPGVMAPPVRLG
ncbi:hypothetical protein GCM10027213_05960 [Mycobacterium bourgelatii]